MRRLYFSYFFLCFIAAGCAIKVIDLDPYHYQKKLDGLRKYKVTDDEAAIFLGLDLTPELFAKISNRISPKQFSLANNLCKDLSVSIPQAWDTIRMVYRIPRKWYKEDTTRCIYNTTTNLIQEVKIRTVSSWSSEISDKESLSPQLQNIRQLHIRTNASEHSRYRFAISSVITAKIVYDEKKTPALITFALDCDYYLQYCMDNLQCKKDEDWFDIPTKEINRPMIDTIRRDMRNLILAKYLKK